MDKRRDGTRRTGGKNLNKKEKNQVRAIVDHEANKIAKTKIEKMSKKIRQRVRKIKGARRGHNYNVVHDSTRQMFGDNAMEKKNAVKLYRSMQDGYRRYEKSYAFQLCFPEDAPRGNLARIPFIANVPTAVVKCCAYQTFEQPKYLPSRDTQTETGFKQFWFSFAPEAMLIKPNMEQIEKQGVTPFPFMCAFTKNKTEVQIRLGNSEPTITADQAYWTIERQQLLSGFNINQAREMRIVGAVCRVYITSKFQSKSGFGTCARVYGLRNPVAHAHIEKNIIMNANYQSSADFTSIAGPSNDVYLRGVYAPADFTDLHLQDPNLWDDKRVENGGNHHSPVIHGLIEGLNDDSVITVVFDHVLEYVPAPDQKAAVDTCTAYDSGNARSGAGNLVSEETNMGVKAIPGDKIKVHTQPLNPAQTVAQMNGTAGDDEWDDQNNEGYMSRAYHTMKEGAKNFGSQFISDSTNFIKNVTYDAAFDAATAGAVRLMLTGQQTHVLGRAPDSALRNVFHNAANKNAGVGDYLKAHKAARFQKENGIRTSSTTSFRQTHSLINSENSYLQDRGSTDHDDKPEHPYADEANARDKIIGFDKKQTHDKVSTDSFRTELSEYEAQLDSNRSKEKDFRRKQSHLKM